MNANIKVYNVSTSSVSVMDVTGFAQSDIDEATIEGSATIYSVRAYKLALSTDELINNGNRDRSRLISYSNLADLSGYVTKGMVSWLDGYYHSDNVKNTTTTHTIKLNIADTNDSESVASAAIDFSASYYIWAKSFDGFIPSNFSDYGVRFDDNMKKLENIFKTKKLLAGKYTSNYYNYGDNANKGEYVSLIGYNSERHSDFSLFILENISFLVLIMLVGISKY
jgi:hypothetical protein